jgi:hypothetical protein
MIGTAYGLTFRLPFACPALLPAPSFAISDVTVVEGHVPRQISAAQISTPLFDAEPGRFLLRGGSHAGRFLVEGGHRITFDRNPTGDDQIIAHHFLHTVVAALLHQRGDLVLHASAALLSDGAAVLSGASGAGKSTVLSALSNRGFPMLSDDVTVLRLQPGGELEVLPGPQYIHLCEDAASHLVTGSAELPRQPWHRLKVTVPAPAPLRAGPLSFMRWASLAAGTGDTLQISSLSGARKMEALVGCLSMPTFAEERGTTLALMRAALQNVQALRIERPAGRWMVDPIIAALLDG